MEENRDRMPGAEDNRKGLMVEDFDEVAIQKSEKRKQAEKLGC